jgi:tetratricopeptide (TPR) repeat protein
MISKIWQWLKRLWFSLKGYYGRSSIDESWEWEQNPTPTPSQSEGNSNSNSIKDQDLGFLFHQLLEGVVNGWQENRIEQFFERLEPRITIEIWLEWLQKYRNQLLSSSAPNYQLAARMIILGEMTASLPFVRPVGDLSYQIGEELLNHNHQNDQILLQSLRSHLPRRNESNDNTEITDQDKIENPNINSEIQQDYSLREILHLLQNDPKYAVATAERLGLNTNNPGIILEQLLKNSEFNLESKNLSNTPTDEAQQDNTNILDNEVQQTEEEEEMAVDEDSAMLYPSDWLTNWFNSGLEKAELGDLEGAISAWDQVLQIDPNVSQAWHNRGSALAYLDRLNESVESFDKAIAINVNDFQSWNDRGNALYNLKRWEEAIISWDRVVGIQPDYYQAWYNRGLALEKLQLWQEALESYQKCLEINSDFTQAQTRIQKLIDRQLVRV